MRGAKTSYEEIKGRVEREILDMQPIKMVVYQVMSIEKILEIADGVLGGNEVAVGNLKEALKKLNELSGGEPLNIGVVMYVISYELLGVGVSESDIRLIFDRFLEETVQRDAHVSAMAIFNRIIELVKRDLYGGRR